MLSAICFMSSWVDMCRGYVEKVAVDRNSSMASVRPVLQTVSSICERLRDRHGEVWDCIHLSLPLERAKACTDDAEVPIAVWPHPASRTLANSIDC
jgi:hypothetical protein